MNEEKIPISRRYFRYCRYGARELYQFLQAMEVEIPGVRKAQDIECIHRMRVASRRARSALRLFKECFPGALLRRWQKEIRNVTRCLGAARDLDVQIEVLKAFRHAHDKAEYKTGIGHILYHVREKRREVQNEVIRSLEKIEAKGILQKISLYLQGILLHGSFRDGPRPSLFMLQRACSLIIDELDALLAYRSYVEKEYADDKLHRMRIAAKHFRYTMEIFSNMYESGLDEYIKAVKKIQKHLGEMHDCVIWLSYLPKLLKTEKKHVARYPNPEQRLAMIERGVHYFEVDRKQVRLREYRAFYEHWQKITADNMFGKLRGYLTQEIKNPKFQIPEK
ncbi:CHAD domain-containing protein [candidate division WOR-3 bacterium]|nr:CHAD domain-containing protein [candidate division WOR-3 bacterium]